MKSLYTPRFGRARIHAESSGLYQPSDDGEPAVVLGVADRYGGLVDIVAWHAESPSQWWVRRGAVPVLGEAEIERAHCLDIPLMLLPTPADWLFQHELGRYWPAACVVDWTADPRITFNGVRIRCAHPALRDRLERAQRRHDRPLRIESAGGHIAA